MTGHSYRVDHLIRSSLERKYAEKKSSADDKASATAVLDRLDGMDVVSVADEW